MKKNAEKRNKYLIQKHFQLKYVILGIIAFIITIGLAQASMYYQLTRLVLEQPQFTGIFAIVQQMNVVFFSWFILGALLILGGGVFVSHRIVGPLKRLEEMLAKVGRGDISGEMRTRKKDEFREVAYAFNSMVHGLRRFLTQDRKLAHEIKEDLQKMKHSLSPETIHQTAEKLEEATKKINEILSNIKM